jgi:hypothetical protein
MYSLQSPFVGIELSNDNKIDGVIKTTVAHQLSIAVNSVHKLKPGCNYLTVVKQICILEEATFLIHFMTCTLTLNYKAKMVTKWLTR